jgi:hypothetical protein
MKRTQILTVLLLMMIANAYGQGIVNFNGVIKDAQTGNLLEGINVFVTEKNTGTITDKTGEFFVFLPGGIYNVSISADGYKTDKFTIDLREDKFSQILLVPSNNLKKKNENFSRVKGRNSEEVYNEKTKLKTVKNS